MSWIGALRARRSRPKLTKQDPVLERPVYADRHRGATALVLGTGPSLKLYEDPLRRLMAEEAPLVLGANHITPFVHPQYHAFTNRKRFATFASTIDPERSRILVSPYFTDELLRLYCPGPYERLQFVADHEAPFGIEDGVVLSSCRSSAILLIAVAIVMGAERILVAGIDGYDPRVPDFYHAPTPELRDDRMRYAEVSSQMGAVLDDIHGYMKRAGLRPFEMVTPTVYERHHRPAVLAAYA